MAVLVLLADSVVLVTTGDHGRPRRAAARTPSTYPPATVPPVDPGETVPPGDPDVTGQVQAPAPGLYRYRSTGRDVGSLAGFAERVEDRPSPPGTSTSHILSTTGVDQTVAFLPNRELELAYAQVGTSVADELSCSENPPRLLLRLPLRPGATWGSRTRCSNFLQDQLLDTREVRVVGPAVGEVAGVATPVWEVMVVSTLTTAPAGQGKPSTQVLTMTLDINARHGVVVRRVIQIGPDRDSIRTDRLVSFGTS